MDAKKIPWFVTGIVAFVLGVLLTLLAVVIISPGPEPTNLTTVSGWTKEEVQDSAREEFSRRSESSQDTVCNNIETMPGLVVDTVLMEMDFDALYTTWYVEAVEQECK